MPEEEKRHDNSKFILMEEKAWPLYITIVSDTVRNHVLHDSRVHPMDFYGHHLGHDFNFIYHSYFQKKDPQITATLDELMDCGHFGAKHCLMVFLYRTCMLLLTQFVDSGTSKDNVTQFLTDFIPGYVLKNKKFAENCNENMACTGCDFPYDPKKGVVMFSSERRQ